MKKLQAEQQIGMRERHELEEQVSAFFATVGISKVAVLDEIMTDHAPLVYDWIHSPASYGVDIDNAPGGDQFDAESAAAAEAIGEWLHDYKCEQRNAAIGAYFTDPQSVLR